MIYKSKYIFQAATIIVASLLFGCASDSESEVDKQKERIAKEIEADNNDRLNSAQKVFVTLPSPFEVASLLKTSGAEYNSEVLNGADNVSQYTTSRSQAINLGIYGADFSIASIFGQTQATIYYLGAIKKLTESLGIASAFDPSTMARFEKNQDDQDSLKRIVNDAYLMANSYLKDNDRSGLSSLILAGGWIEGLYIATNLYNAEDPNSDLMVMIAEQKYSLENLVTLLEGTKSDPGVETILVDFQGLQELFDQIEEGADNGLATVEGTDEKEGKTTFGGGDDLVLTNEQLAIIAAEVKRIRMGFVK